MIEYPWPSPPGISEKPVWTGRGFLLGDKLEPVLLFETGESGWTDALTSFRENTAGADHFIDLASRQYALGQLKEYMGGRNPVVLEVGCSSGFMLRLIRESFPQALVIGSDYVAPSLFRFAREMPAIPLLQFDLCRCPLPDKTIDAVVLLNVLEHIPNDRAAIAQIYRLLKPGGIAVIEVPAGPHLYDICDRLLMHERRYSYPMLRNLVHQAGFQILSRSHLGFFLYPGFGWVKRRDQKRFSADESVQKKIVAQNIRTTKGSRLLMKLMNLELLLGRRVSYPWGIRCLMTCRRVS